ncbi:MAG: lipoprotein [Filomicrobium sp.]
MSSLTKTCVVAAILALTLAGCGIRGSLDAPPQAKAEGAATSPVAKGSAEGTAGPQKQHRPFILDGLLR